MKISLKVSVIALLYTLFIAPATAADLTVATAAGYKKPLNEIYTAFTDATGIQIDSAFGNIKQIEAQARQNPDIQMLIGDWYFIEPMGFSKKHQQLGQGKLILVTTKGTHIESINDLKEKKIQKIAIGDRKSTIYGKAAIECLKEHDMLDIVEVNLIQVSTLPQVSAYVLTGEVDAGFVNLSEAMAHADKFSSSIEMPHSCYRPIDLSIVPIDDRSNTPEAKALLEFLETDIAKNILKRHGLN